MIGSGYVFALACDAGHLVNVALGASSSPIERAIDLLESRRTPSVLAYAKIGTLPMAIRVRIELRAALAQWHAHGCWLRIPISDGAEFRSLLRWNLERHAKAGVPIELHHVDMKEYFANQRRVSLRTKTRFKVGRARERIIAAC